MSDNKYLVDYAKRQAGCKKCKAKIEKGELRIAKVTANPFSDDGDMKLFHHPHCIFETFKRARATTKIIEEPGDIEGFDDIKDEDKELIRKLIKENSKDGPGSAKKGTPKKAGTPKKTKPETEPAKITAFASPSKKTATRDEADGSPTQGSPEKRPKRGDLRHKDNSFKEFRRICARIADEASYNSKTDIVRKFFKGGTDGKGFQGDLYVWVRLLLPGVVKRIYNIQSKQLVKIFSKIFKASEEAMLEDLEKGDVAETIATFLEQSKTDVKASSKSKLTVHEIDDFLQGLSKLTKEDDQRKELSKITTKCTQNDLKMLIRLIKHDLRIQAGAKHILDGLHKDAYEAFNSTRNITSVLDKVVELHDSGNPHGALDVGITLMHPVQPMLAMACKSVDMAFSKCPNGMYAEIKYDGERVQLHKKGDEFKYYSRSLKPVLPHKVKHFAQHIPKAFPDGSDLILDAEVLMVDNETGDPLPFGTLGKHKAAGFASATPCLFVFDCIYYNGKSLLNMAIKDRRKLLLDHMKEVDNHVKFSEAKLITQKSQLGDMIKRVLKQGLEGLVLKDLKSVYEPGKRHWLKVKKDYLNEGAMADSADLVVLGAWYGTGNKGGIMSIFLMGCYDEKTDRWCTVTKVHTGVDDATLEKLQKDLNPLMTKIKQDFSKVPGWLSCTRNMTPDFLAKDPQKMPVWEITGAEFTKAEIHTADGLSIRFPRITKRRDDKSWETATSLSELKELFKASKESTDYDIDYSTTTTEDTESASDTTATVKGELSDSTSSLLSVKENVNVNGASYNKTHIETSHGFVLDVVYGDLFQGNDKACLAHCVSQDFRLGKGIAKAFVNKFPELKTLAKTKTSAQIGDAVDVKRNGRFIYNLVTKAKYSDKPTYESLQKSLESMRDHAKKNGVKEIAMPKIGCGLDGLSWNAVRTLIKNVFLEEAIKITVFTLEKEYERSNVKASPVKSNHSVSSTDKKNPIKAMFDTTQSKKRKAADDEESDVDEGTSSSKRNKPDVSRKRKPEFSDEVKSKSPRTELPDIFDGWRVYLTEGVDDPDKLKRYVIAFGGEVLQDHESSEATHVIYKEKTRKKLKGGQHHVTQDFLIDSIKLKEIQDMALYQA